MDQERRDRDGARRDDAVEAYEGQAKDYEFGPETMREHWEGGLEDMRATLRRREWLRMPEEDPGIAVHDGPLHKDPENCRLNSDCGFGTRLLPRLGLEIGYRLDAASAITMLYDHMSHKGIIGGENEGIEHIGLRYLRRY